MVPANKDDDEIRKHKATIEEFQNAIVSVLVYLNRTHILSLSLNTYHLLVSDGVKITSSYECEFEFNCYNSILNSNINI